MVKKQLAIDGRLSHAKDLSIKEVKLILTLLHRYFTQLAKTLGKKSPKGSSDKALFTQIQKEAPNPNWTPAQYERYIKRLKKLQTAAANQKDTKGLSESANEIVKLLAQICSWFTPLEKGYKTASKKPAKGTIRKKQDKERQPEFCAPDKNRLNAIIKVIGLMESENCHYITADAISKRMKHENFAPDQNSNAQVRSCIYQHRSHCSGNPLIGVKRSPGNNEYSLTEEGKKRYQELTAS